jgi:hypothetical protein
MQTVSSSCECNTTTVTLCDLPFLQQPAIHITSKLLEKVAEQVRSNLVMADFHFFIHITKNLTVTIILIHLQHTKKTGNMNSGGGYTRCGYDVPGMILLQACLFTYRLLRQVTFTVLPLSSYAPSSTMLTLLKTCLELLMWNSF